MNVAYQAIFEHRATQKEPELKELVQRLDGVRLRRVLEIGTEYGGTLWLWAQLADPNAQLVALDRTLNQLIQPLPRLGQSIAYICADSHASDTLARVTDSFDGPIDLLFVDGDHSYEGVKQDYETYEPLVADGGVVVFHDINPHPDCGVARFWEELEGDKWESIFPHPFECQHAMLPAVGCGIGVLRVVR